jgi:hypothetical protein
LLLGLAAVCLFLTGSGRVLQARQGGGKTDVQGKFKKGATFYTETTTETEQAMTVAGNKLDQTQKQTYYSRWTIKGQDKQKNWILVQQIEAIKSDMVVGGNKISYDSTKGMDQGAPLGEVYQALLNAELTFTVRPSDLVIVKLDGRQAVLKKLDNLAPEMKNLMKTMLEEGALRQMADPLFAAVPNKSVKPGESWVRATAVSMGPIGTYQQSSRFTFQGKDKKTGLARISEEVTMKWRPPSDVEPADPLPFKIKKANLKSDRGSGLIEFDLQKGRVVRSTSTIELQGTMTIDIAGAETEVEMRQQQRTQTKVTDANPLQK